MHLCEAIAISHVPCSCECCARDAVEPLAVTPDPFIALRSSLATRFGATDGPASRCRNPLKCRRRCLGSGVLAFPNRQAGHAIDIGVTHGVAERRRDVRGCTSGHPRGRLPEPGWVRADAYAIPIPDPNYPPRAPSGRP